MSEVKEIVKNVPDWEFAANKFDIFFGKMANPDDALWSNEMMKILRDIYYKARKEDKSCKSITIRTVNAMPEEWRNDTKKILLQIADICRIFHAGHKVNFEANELPQNELF